MVRGAPPWRIDLIRPNCRFRLNSRVQGETHLAGDGTVSPPWYQHFWKPSHSTAVILYKNDRSFWRYTPAQSGVRFVPCNSTGAS
jgi:hypothetical protein